MTSSTTVRIGLIGDYDPTVIAHQAIPKSLQRAQDETGRRLEFVWVATDSIEDADRQLTDYHGLWCVPHSPYRSMEGALAAIHFARVSGRPFIGT
jgi:CTP synthase (UTP-ammonia lyase)